MPNLEPFTHEILNNAPKEKKAEMLRRWHKWLKEQRDEDERLAHNLNTRIYRRKRRKNEKD